MQVFVIANADKNKFRSWNELGPCWIDNKRHAIWFSRRIDAERMCLTDEDAWHVIPINPLEVIKEEMRDTIEAGNAAILKDADIDV